MKKALIIIDYTNDFVADDGKLTCGKPGQDIEMNIVSLIEEFSKNGDFVVDARDNHDQNDCHNKERTMFPLHCYDDYGRDHYGKVKEVLEAVPEEQRISISKNRYSAFFGTPLDLKLKERKVEEVHLVGVCTDICVMHGAVDAYNLGYQIVVHSNGVASFNENGHIAALDHFKNVLCAKVI